MSNPQSAELYSTQLKAGGAGYGNLVVDMQRRRDSLRGVLNSVGSLVLDSGVRETDADIAPHNFTRRGVTEYVFPPQETVPVAGQGDITLDPDPGYSLTGYEDHYSYVDTPARVKGRLRITYDDANDPPVMAVHDLLGNSELPSEAQTALETAFEGLTLATRPA